MLTSVYISLIFFLALTNNCNGEDEEEVAVVLDDAAGAPAIGAELLRSSLKRFGCRNYVIDQNS